MKKRYKIITYGCQMNERDSEKLTGDLEAEGYVPAADAARADVIVFNTCCVREGAEHRVYSNLGALRKLKERKPGLIIAVAGCMAQSKTAFDILKSRFPYVDIIFGTHNSHMFREFLNERVRTGKRVCERVEKESDADAGGERAARRRVGEKSAFVSIMYGCDNFCSYCIVPYVRGRERSRAPKSILSEIETLVKDGRRDITLLGQNVNSYRGGDGADKTNFAALLRAVNGADGDFMCGYMTSHPKDMSDEVIEATASLPKIKKEIHLPVQSGGDAVLAAMNRGYTAAHYTGIIEKIRRRMPTCVLTSDIIVGFPGESESDYEATLGLVRRARFDNLYMFMYSERPGTAAAELPNKIPDAVKRERLKKLIELQRGIQIEKAAEARF